MFLVDTPNNVTGMEETYLIVVVVSIVVQLGQLLNNASLDSENLSGLELFLLHSKKVDSKVLKIGVSDGQQLAGHSLNLSVLLLNDSKLLLCTDRELDGLLLYLLYLILVVALTVLALLTLLSLLALSFTLALASWVGLLSGLSRLSGLGRNLVRGQYVFIIGVAIDNERLGTCILTRRQSRRGTESQLAHGQGNESSGETHLEI